MKRERYFRSADGRTNIYTISWEPAGEVRGIVQIAHGMVEYIGRYERLAKVLTARGFLVVGQDLLGHGRSVVRTPEDLGYFCPHRGNQVLLADMHHLYTLVRRRYPAAPYFMLGHSMGSFLLRQYLGRYQAKLAGAIIMGTGHYARPLLLGGRLLAAALTGLRGGHYRSRLIHNLGFGGFNRHFPDARTPYDWITTDEAERDKYQRDPLCTFLFTVNGYYNMFTGMLRMQSRRLMRRIPPQLPLLFVSGSADAVGEFERGVRRVVRDYERAGLDRLTLRFYPEDRHEILNDRHRARVMDELGDWLSALL